MMRRLVERHRGILPLDTAESIWRVIIATFTYVQAPFSVHADLSAGEAAMRDTRALPFRLHGAVRAAHGRRRRGRGGRGIAAAISAWCRRPAPRRAVVDGARRRRCAEDHRAAALRRARRPSGRPAGVRDRAAEPRRDGDRRRDLEHPRRRLGSGGVARARSIGGSDRRAGPRLRRRRTARLGAAEAAIDALVSVMVKAGASVRSKALVGSHATRYTVTAAGPVATGR